MRLCASIWNTRDNGYANKILASQGPTTLRRSEQVGGGPILIEEERREFASPQRLPPQVGELMWRARVRPEPTSPGKTKRCDEPRTEMPRGRHVSNNDGLRTSSRDVSESIGSMTAAIRGNVMNSSTHSHTYAYVRGTYNDRPARIHYTPCVFLNPDRQTHIMLEYRYLYYRYMYNIM